MKKSPSSHILRALRAIATVRSGNRDEAYRIVRKVMAEKPTDLVILQTLVFSLRALGKKDDIVELHQTAYEQAPNDEELANHYFMALARTTNFHKWQQVALNLSRTYPHPKYRYWNIVATFLQAKYMDPEKATVLLTLCERMLQKLATENKIANAEQLGLYIDVLTALGCDKAVIKEVLDRHLHLVKVEEEVWRMHLDLLPSGEERRDLACTVLKKNADDWAAWTAYLDSVTALDAPVEDVHAYITLMQTTARTRGAFLAALEYARRRADTDPAPMAAYWQFIGHKPCFYNDVTPYLAAYRDWVASLTHVVQATPKSATLGVNLRKMRRHLALDSVDAVDAILDEYLAARSVDEDLLPTERREADEFITLAALYLVDGVDKDAVVLDNRVVRAIGLLENGVERSPKNFQFKLLLIRLYLHLGNVSRPLALFESMDIKSIQLDTLSHTLLESMGDLGFLRAAQGFIHESTRIYADNERETPEMVVQAFTHGTVTQVPDFIRFYYRLARSTARMVARAESWRWSLVAAHRDVKGLTRAVGEVEEEVPIGLEELFENRDTVVMERFVEGGQEVLVPPPKDRVFLGVVARAQRVIRGVVSGDAELVRENVEVLLSEEDARFAEVTKVVALVGKSYLAATAEEEQAKDLGEHLTAILDVLHLTVERVQGVVGETKIINMPVLKALTSVVELIHLATIATHLPAFATGKKTPEWIKSAFTKYRSDLQPIIEAVQTTVTDVQAKMTSTATPALRDAVVAARNAHAGELSTLPDTWVAQVGDDWATALASIGDHAAQLASVARA
ncbi:hypothetical protein AMAG_14547 [Allomyces macrogynus ATCC 38327]|uniref:Uncharacterized protein n=1 Tax=Allomyces macrogynus (strain ATCC 38327) TaxID=578462 RepID=A0A0L0T6I5_ALLM3|nr:hypothetical protein AMAG_14547 [Allomyces macrogynus ATCC 38327]|eukprot:KNE70413.1 hypothetical protein AMAG_14547 [Allomyces macrogynus ATCC 38327]